MKKTISRLSICLLLFGALTSCTAPRPDYTMVEGYDTETLDNGYGLPVNSCRMLSLEASPECMLGNPSKVEVLDSQIVVLDNEKLYVFGMDGRFRYHIGRKRERTQRIYLPFHFLHGQRGACAADRFL